MEISGGNNDGLLSGGGSSDLSNSATQQASRHARHLVFKVGGGLNALHRPRGSRRRGSRRSCCGRGERLAGVIGPRGQIQWGGWFRRRSRTRWGGRLGRSGLGRGLLGGGGADDSGGALGALLTHELSR
uniref:Uncharacterized protein n=1 Tax=Oryza nivara TaxID=4536 RepID=A0A0E0FHV1_ORYNI